MTNLRCLTIVLVKCSCFKKMKTKMKDHKDYKDERMCNVDRETFYKKNYGTTTQDWSCSIQVEASLVDCSL